MEINKDDKKTPDIANQDTNVPKTDNVKDEAQSKQQEPAKVESRDAGREKEDENQHLADTTDNGPEDEEAYQDDGEEGDYFEGDEGEEGDYQDGEEYDDQQYDDGEGEEQYDDEQQDGDVYDEDYAAYSDEEEQGEGNYTTSAPPAQKQADRPAQDAKSVPRTMETERPTKGRNQPSWMKGDPYTKNKQMQPRRRQREQDREDMYMRPQQQMQQMQPQPQSGGDGGGKNPLKLRLDLNLEIEIELKARIHGDLTLALLDGL